MDGPVLAVLAAYQNNLVASRHQKMMTSQAVQCLPFQTSTKADFLSESVKQSCKLSVVGYTLKRDLVTVSKFSDTLGDFTRYTR